MKEEKDLDYSWRCKNCTLDNNAASHECHMCWSAQPRKQAKLAIDSSLPLDSYAVIPEKIAAKVSLESSSLPIFPCKNKLSSKQKQSHQTTEPRLLSSTARVSLDQDQKPTWEEKKLIKEQEHTLMLDDVSSFNCSKSSGINDDLDNNGETISLREAALLEQIARLQHQLKEQDHHPNELNNANQVKHDRGLSWSFNKNDQVPDDIVNVLYKQLNPTLRLTKEQFSKAVNALTAMSEHVVLVGTDPSVNSGLVDIINGEFKNRSILYATDAPLANANGPHIDAFFMDSIH